jgi:hypothetical protein
MKDSLTDEPELCFYAKKTTRRQNFDKVGEDFFFKKKFRNFLVYSLLMPVFVQGYFFALLCF